jgi:hypothetical protein
MKKMSYYIGKRNHEKHRIARYILRVAKKMAAINLLGGHCKYCNETHLWVLQFHHIRKKKCGIHSLKACSWKRIKEEINKCELVCENCHREITGKKTVEKATRHKLLLLNYKGILSCEQCNYNKCLKALDFHHTGIKKIDLSNLITKKWTVKMTPEIKRELDKCKILCANCHRGIHFDIEMFNKYKAVIEEKAQNLEDNYTHKVDREKLFELHKMGYTQYKIAKILKCGNSTVCEILKSNGIHSYKLKRKENRKVIG